MRNKTLVCLLLLFAAILLLPTSTPAQPALPPVLCDRLQLQQVVMNLLINGIQAMIPVTDRPHELSIRLHRHEGEQALIEVQDTGVGIPPENMKQLFNAFFSTKPDGMGMGLSICRSIVEAHGGCLWASPNLPYGSVFRFIVPVMVDRISASSSG